MPLTNWGYYAVPVLLLAACGPPQQPVRQATAVPVTVQKVSKTQVAYYDEYPATVVAINQVDLRPQVNGYITGIHFKEGDHVQKGKALYSLDQQQYEAVYQQALANVAAQEANLVRAKKDVDRYRELEKRDAVPRQQVDNAVANYETAVQQVEAAKAAVESVRTNVRYTTIYAPFDGTIGVSQVRLGTAVSAGQTLLNTISTDDPMAVDISIDQREIFRFTQLQQVTTQLQDSIFRLAFNGDVYPFPGKMSFIDRAVNSQTGTIIIRFVFSNSKNLLRAGMNGTLRVRNNPSEKSMLIPYKAVTEQLGEFFVYVVRTDSNKVTQQKVVLGSQIDRDVIVKAGLKDGETIVTEGIQNLREGSPVSLGAGTDQKKAAANN